MTAVATSCPECGAPIPESPWPPWCESCSWGVVASEPPPPRNRIDALYRRLGERTGRRRADQYAVSESFRPRWTAQRIAAIAIALLVHLLTLAFVVAAVLLVVKAWTNPFADLLALILLGSAWLMRPRFGDIPEGARVTADDAPSLHALIGSVASELGHPAPDVVVVDHEWNASFGHVGIRRQRVLTIGLPLLTALAPQERVALVAHELAHDRNGDSTRGVVCSTALDALSELYLVLQASNHDTLFESVHRWVSWVVTRPVLGLIVLEVLLLRQDSQRAEYLADALAAEVAGTDAAVSLSETLLLTPTFYAIVSRNTHGASARGDSMIFADLDAAVAAVTPRERERRRRIARLETSRLHDSHPPTALRIELLERRPHLEARVTLDPASAAAMDDELARHRKAAAARLVDDARDRLYY